MKINICVQAKPYFKLLKKRNNSEVGFFQLCSLASVISVWSAKVIVPSTGRIGAVFEVNILLEAEDWIEKGQLRKRIRRSIRFATKGSYDIPSGPLKILWNSMSWFQWSRVYAFWSYVPRSTYVVRGTDRNFFYAFSSYAYAHILSVVR